MPRGPRLDYSGTLHHIMFRGIEGAPIVTDDHDRAWFLDRLAHLAYSSNTSIYAWALMDNHAHLLLKSGRDGLSAFMRKLLTGYAVSFNKRHKRHGYLFQNRYKSIICQEERYFLKLVAYIHLNPYRARLADSLEKLDYYPWCGHSVLMNNCTNEWQECHNVLALFGQNESDARNAYRAFVEDQSKSGHQPELTGGGLLRSQGGWSEVKSRRKPTDKRAGDERILGDEDFVHFVLDQANENLKSQLCLKDTIKLVRENLDNLCIERGISMQALQSGVRTKLITRLRHEQAIIMVKQYGLSLAETARLLGISTPAVYKIVNKSNQS